jgi:C4-type Zn-finger protein
MRLHDIPFGLVVDDGCPVCNSRITLTEVEPHPHRDELEIHEFSCQFCGPVKSLVVPSPAEEEPALLRMMM